MNSRQPELRTDRKTLMPPRGEKPGFKGGRYRPELGKRLPYWMASQVLRQVPPEFPDPCIPLPPEADDAEISRLCLEHTARLQRWLTTAAAEQPDLCRTRYDGTIKSACRIYQEHPYSPFNASVKANTRRTYLTSLNLIEATVGPRLIRNVTVIDCKQWYIEWRAPDFEDDSEHVDRAHDAISMLKTVLRFNAALRRVDCKQLADELEKVRFEKGGASEEELNLAQVAAFIRAADDLAERGIIDPERALYMSIGIAAQFELMLRPKDVIGEYHKRLRDAERAIAKGAAHVDVAGDRWTGWLTWERVPGWRWRMRTSKSKYRSAVEFDLTIYGLLFPLLERVPHADRQGAIVKGEGGLPFRERTYQKGFRKIASAAGIPVNVKGMHARPGGATEAEEAGVELKLIQEGGLIHEDPATSPRYIRRRSKKAAAVAQARQQSRQAGEGGST